MTSSQSSSSWGSWTRKIPLMFCVCTVVVEVVVVVVVEAVVEIVVVVV